MKQRGTIRYTGYTNIRKVGYIEIMKRLFVDDCIVAFQERRPEEDSETKRKQLQRNMRVWNSGANFQSECVALEITGWELWA